MRGTARPIGRRLGSHASAGLASGLSGAPLGARATAVVLHNAQQARGSLPLVGGILSAADALAKVRAAAALG